MSLLLRLSVFYIFAGCVSSSYMFPSFVHVFIFFLADLFRNSLGCYFLTVYIECVIISKASFIHVISRNPVLSCFCGFRTVSLKRFGLVRVFLPVRGWVRTPTKSPDPESHILLATRQFKRPIFQIQECFGRVLFPNICYTKAKLMNGHDSRPPVSARASPARLQRRENSDLSLALGWDLEVGDRVSSVTWSALILLCVPQSLWSGSGTANTWASISVTAATRTRSRASLPGSSGCGTSGGTMSAISPNGCWTAYGSSPSSICCTSAMACIRRPRSWTEWGWVAAFPGKGVQRLKGSCGSKWTSPPAQDIQTDPLRGRFTIQRMELMLQRPSPAWALSVVPNRISHLCVVFIYT